MRITCETLNAVIEVPPRPERIVSLVSSATEALFAMGCGERVVGVSTYCPRYVPNLQRPLVGDYLRVEEEQLARLEPDLVLVTTGVQRSLGLALLAQGYPVYALPLPTSLHGILENVNLLGGLVNEAKAARRLMREWEEFFQGLRRRPFTRRPRVYAELWFGKHLRTVGALSFVNDLIEVAGGENIFGADRRAYFVPDLEEVARLRPEVLLVHTEPEHPVSVPGLLEERGWHRWEPPPLVVETSVERGRNIIHDGPSMMETALWLHGLLASWAALGENA